jgi:tetratricopeptide (TPR) repeat protein
MIPTLRRARSYPLMLTCTLLLAADAAATGRRDWCLIPLGSFPLQPGTQEIRVARPYDRFGIIDSPIVLVALFDPDQRPPVPGQIRFAAAERPYPAWSIRQPGQMYVIGSATLERDSAPDGQHLTLRVEVRNCAPKLALMASGAADLALAGEAALGPLDEVVRKLPRSTAQEYLKAVVAAAGGGLQRAKRDFTRLASSSDKTTARFARAALRRIRFAEAEAKMKHDFATHYRFGLYAQHCGMFRAARLHFEKALAADQRHPDAWFRLGEMMERCGDPLEDVAAVMERAGQTAGIKANDWDVLVTLLQSEKYYDVQDGREVELHAQISRAQIEQIKRQWHWVEQMIYGASGGRLELNTRFMDITAEAGRSYTTEPCGVFGPADEFIPLRGSYDSVLSFRPRGKAETVGADCGPSGAALSDIGAGAAWDIYLREWMRQFDWTVRTGELLELFPIADHSDGCGHQPIPSLGYGLRAALRYYVPPAAYRRIETADPDTGAGYLRAWLVSDPVGITGDEPATGGTVQKHGPDKTRDWPRRLVVSQTDFVDLNQIYVDAGLTPRPPAITAVTAFLRAPARLEARLWLGFNDGIALWLNGRIIHRGNYYAANKFADRNLTNTLAKAVTLREGWNRIDCAVEAWPEPFDRGFGFSVRICDFDNRPIEGLRAAERERDVPASVMPDTFLPRPGKLYRWDAVRDDCCDKLPRLTAEWLREYAGLHPDFQIRGRIDGVHGYLSLGSSADVSGRQRGGVTIHALMPDWNILEDRDLQLNNLLDWSHESVAVYPFLKHPAAAAGAERHLLVIRPEATEAFLTCLRESPQAAQLFGTSSVQSRILGYVRVGEGEHARNLIVAETLLPTPLPIDEEDLLSP